MPTSAVPQGTLSDPWPDHARYVSTRTSKRARSAAGGYNQSDGAGRSRGKAFGGSRQKDSTKARDLDRYEACLAKTLERGPGRPGSHSPAMDVWAMALGVEMENSKSTERARRKVELEEAGRSMEPGGWSKSAPRSVSLSSLPLRRRRKRCRDTPDGPARAQASDVAALDGFLSDLQRRLNSVEGGAVRSSGTTVVPSLSRSVLSGGDAGSEKGVVPASGRACAASVGSADVYGIPQAFIANAEEVRSSTLQEHSWLCCIVRQSKLKKVERDVCGAVCVGMQECGIA